jgi:putative nucleotidyltransferase with HDIG domain
MRYGGIDFTMGPTYFLGGSMSSQTPIGITRDDAMMLLKTHLSNDKLISHCLASEAIMRALAEKFGEDPDLWGMAGLLHDLDYEITGEDSAVHGLETEKLLNAKGVSPVLSNVIKKHNAEGLGLERTTLFEYALTCAETITGMIVATALVYPDKKIASVKPKSVTKRMKTKHFARAVSRERIMECEKMGMPLNEFVSLSLKAMEKIAGDIGL